jgi:hypothetical protein
LKELEENESSGLYTSQSLIRKSKIFTISRTEGDYAYACSSTIDSLFGRKSAHNCRDASGQKNVTANEISDEIISQQMQEHASSDSTNVILSETKLQRSPESLRGEATLSISARFLDRLSECKKTEMFRSAQHDKAALRGC